MARVVETGSSDSRAAGNHAAGIGHAVPQHALGQCASLDEQLAQAVGDHPTVGKIKHPLHQQGKSGGR